MSQYRIVRGNDDNYYPQYKGWFGWRYFHECIQYEITVRVKFATHQFASDFLQRELDGEHKKVKFKPLYFIPWIPKQ